MVRRSGAAHPAFGVTGRSPPGTTRHTARVIRPVLAAIVVRSGGTRVALCKLMKAFARCASVLGAVGLAGFAMTAAIGCGGNIATQPNPQARAGAGGNAALGGAGDLTPGGVGAGVNAGGSGGDAGNDDTAGGAGQAGEAGAIELPAPWDEHSRHIELDCFAYFDGSMRFKADRAQLSAKELHLLAGLRSVRPGDACAEDQLRCHVAVTSDSGEVAEYVADELNAFCDGSEPAIAFDSLAPFLAETDCSFARYESAGPRAPSEGCFHGRFADSASVTDEELELAEAGRPYHVEVEYSGTRCEVTLELKGGDPSVLLAVGTSLERETSGKVIGLDVEVQTPITAHLLITRSAGCPAGDFYLNFR